MSSVSELVCDWEMGPQPIVPIKTQPDQEIVAKYII